MMSRQIELEIESGIFNSVYKPYLHEQARTQIFFGGASSGKSVFAAQRVVLDVLSESRNYLIVRNVAATIRKSIYNEILKTIIKFKVGDLFHVNKSEMVITCVNGYQIMFGGLDDPEKIKSITPAQGVITDVLVEEATEATANAVRQLNKRLRGQSKASKRLTLLFNPVFKTHWIYKEYFGGWDESKSEFRSPELTILKTTYRDNAFLTEDDRRDLENERDPYFYNVYTLGNWGVLGNVVFKNWRTADLRDFEPTKQFAGLDFGYAEDPAALIVGSYDKARKRVYILKEHYERKLTNDKLAGVLREAIGKMVVRCDSAEPKSIQELRNEGINAYSCKKGKDSILHGLQWLQQQEIIVDKECVNFIQEIQTYKWQQDKEGNAIPKPVDANNHLMDALRYGAEEYMADHRLKIAAV